MLSKSIKFVKEYRVDILLVIGVILISLFSFAVGYIIAKKELKQDIKFDESTYYWSRYSRSLSKLEIS